MGVPGLGAGALGCESCHGTQSTYHAKCRGECSSGPGRPSIPGKLIVINQVTETEQGLADDYLSPPLSSSSHRLPPLFVFHLLPPSCSAFPRPRRGEKSCTSAIRNLTPTHAATARVCMCAALYKLHFPFYLSQFGFVDYNLACRRLRCLIKTNRAGATQEERRKKKKKKTEGVRSWKSAAPFLAAAPLVISHLKTVAYLAVQLHRSKTLAQL